MLLLALGVPDGFGGVSFEGVDGVPCGAVGAPVGVGGVGCEEGADEPSAVVEVLGTPCEESLSSVDVDSEQLIARANSVHERVARMAGVERRVMGQSRGFVEMHSGVPRQRRSDRLRLSVDESASALILQ